MSKWKEEPDLIISILMLFCLITFFCLSDNYMRTRIIIGVLATVGYMYWYMSGGDR